MNWNSPDSNAQKILKEIDKKLEEKKVYGIGEVLVRHWLNCCRTDRNNNLAGRCGCCYAYFFIPNNVRYKKY